MKKSFAEYWAPRINAEWRRSVQGILNVGRQLIAAKEACEHGEFMRLFKGSENALPDPVPFGIHTADRLMAIATKPAIADCAHAHNLPQSWATLYELTKLDDEQITSHIEAGEITPDMTRAEAVALRADPIDYGRPNLTQGAAEAAVGVVRIPRWIAAVARWTDPDSCRFALGAVAIESDGFNATAVATDGRRIAVVTAPQGNSMDARLPSVPPFLAPADQLARAIKQVPPRWKPGTRLAEANGDGSEHFVTIEANGDGTATVAAADGSGTPVTITLCCNGRFPDWRAAVDAQAADDRTTPTLYCNPELLADVAFLAQAAKAHSVAVRFNGSRALVGQFETIDGCKGMTLVMGQEPAASSEWIGAERQRIETVRHYASQKRKTTATEEHDDGRRR